MVYIIFISYKHGAFDTKYFWFSQLEGWLQESSGQRLKMLLKILQCTGQPPNIKDFFDLTRQ